MRRTKLALMSCTVLLALLGIGASIEHLLDPSPYNPGFLDHPWITRLHVVPGALYLALALPQFARGLRAGAPGIHRTVGRLAVAAGLLAGTTALTIALAFPFSGRLAIAVVGPFAVLFVFALARGFWLARAGRFSEHRAWMIRALAIGTSIATMRLLFVPAFHLLGEATDERARGLSLACFAAAFVLHSTVAELWIRATRGAAYPFSRSIRTPGSGLGR